MSEDKGTNSNKTGNSNKKSFSIKEIGLPKIITAILCGIALLMLSVPGMWNKNANQSRTYEPVARESISAVVGSDTNSAYVENMEQKLETMLRKVDGIGDVEVMVTLKTSKEQIALKNSANSQVSNSETDSQGGTRVESNTTVNEETVMSQSGSGESSPYVVKEIEPEVEGVLVIAKGGDNSKIISEINSAVQVLFDVPAHKIKVMKMI